MLSKVATEATTRESATQVLEDFKIYAKFEAEVAEGSAMAYKLDFNDYKEHVAIFFPSLT